MKRILSTVKSVGNAQSVWARKTRLSGVSMPGQFSTATCMGIQPPLASWTIGPGHWCLQDRRVSERVNHQIDLQLVAVPEVSTVGAHGKGEDDTLDVGRSRQLLLDGRIAVVRHPRRMALCPPSANPDGGSLTRRLVALSRCCHRAWLVVVSRSPFWARFCPATQGAVEGVASRRRAQTWRCVPSFMSNLQDKIRFCS